MTTDPSGTARPRHVLLTGVGKPGQVGEAVARAFAAGGDHVVLVDRRIEDSRSRAEALRDLPGRCDGYAADLADPADVERLAGEIGRDVGGQLDAVVHMAGGWMPGSSLVESSPADWNTALTINLTTAVCTVRAFAPMLRPRRGAFVFFASEAALPGARVAGLAAYAVAKQGVVTIMRALAEEERSHGVRANALAPAAIRTATNEASMGTDAPYVERDDVAAAVLWLCSAAAGAVSGEVIRLAASPRDSHGA